MSLPRLAGVDSVPSKAPCFTFVGCWPTYCFDHGCLSSSMDFQFGREGEQICFTHLRGKLVWRNHSLEMAQLVKPWSMNLYGKYHNVTNIGFCCQCIEIWHQGFALVRHLFLFAVLYRYAKEHFPEINSAFSGQDQLTVHMTCMTFFFFTYCCLIDLYHFGTVSRTSHQFLSVSKL